LDPYGVTMIHITKIIEIIKNQIKGGIMCSGGDRRGKKDIACNTCGIGVNGYDQPYARALAI
jgi:hypothetical protein